MEKVLYDVYLAEAVINTDYPTFSSDSLRKQELFSSVLKKHKITQVDLDTSLAWYAGHLEKYFKINDNLSKRFTKETETLRQKDETAMKSIAPNNATVLPVKKERFLLTSSDLLKNAAYTFKADTAISWYGGVYELQFNILGVSASLRPVVTLCVQCTDTTFVKRDTINQNGLFATYLTVLQRKQAKKLYGSIYFPDINPRTTVFIHRFSLSHSFSQPPH